MATSSKEVATKHSKYHPQRPCSACVLCGKTHPHYEAWAKQDAHMILIAELK